MKRLTIFIILLITLFLCGNALADTRALQVESLLDPVIDSSGNILSDGTVYFYDAGTTTPKNVWTEKEKTNAYTSRTLGSDGTIQVYGDGIYRILIKDSDGTTVHDWDNIKIKANTFSILQKSATYTVTPDDDFILVDTDGGDVTINLQTVDDFEYPVNIKNIGSNDVIIDPDGSETIDGSATVTIGEDNQSITIIPDTTSSIWRQSLPRLKSITDDDGDTLVQVEESSDEDKIRFDTAGEEQMVLEDGKLEPSTDEDLDIGSSSKKINNFYVATVRPKHVIVTQMTTGPVTAADEGGVWVKENNGQAELYFTEESAGDDVQITSDGDVVLPRSYLVGLVMSNDTDSDHDILVAVGEARDAGDSFNIALASATAKQLDATWAAGDDAGGLNSADFATGASGPEANTWYHVFVLGGSGTEDVCFDKDVSATNCLGDAAVSAANLTKYRRIGSILTDGSENILAFKQYADEFWWAVPVLDVDTATQSTSDVDRALTVPSDINVIAIINAYAATNLVHIKPKDVATTWPAPAGANSALVTIDGGYIGHMRIRTDTSGIIVTDASNANTIVKISTLGWVDRRGRDD